MLVFVRILKYSCARLVTLPALIYSQMGNYRIDAAAGTALVLGAMSLLLISLFERLAARR